jgi:hypothetical protein
LKQDAARVCAILACAVVAGLLGGVPDRAQAAPIILPSAHPIATSRTIAVEVVTPRKAKVCDARIGRDGHSTRRFPVKLGGPSRRLSWHFAPAGNARWTVSVTCGKSAKRPASLGTSHRGFQVRDGRGRPRLRVLPGSFRSTRGFLPAHAPPPLPSARASIASEVDTSVAKPCPGNEWMSSAYAIGTDYASRVGFTPTANRVENIGQLWHSIEKCVNFPNLLNDPRESMIKQMACYEFYGPAPGPGVTYDMEGWRQNPAWEVAMKSKNKCEKWANVDQLTADESLQGWVVQGSLDTSSQRAAYLVEGKPGTGNWWKDHIEDPKAYYCTLQSHNGPLVVPSDFITEELSHNGPAVGDTACNAVPPSYGPPPGTAQAGGLYLDQGPAAPGGGYWYAVTLTGFPPSSSVPITCRDSVSPGGFLTFTMHTDIAGDAQSTSGCYSGDGPEHWVTAPSAESAHISWGSGSTAPAPTPSPAPAPATTWSEQETPNHPVNTFTNYHNASGMGPAIASGQWVQVSCKVYDPTIASVNPDGYWYRIASSPWSNAYYSPANTFMNGDPYGGPYTHNTDFAVPNC